MRNSRPILFALIVLPASFVATQWVRADPDVRAFCRLAIHEERVELDDQVLNVELSESTLKAAEEIFVLVDGLWKNQAIQRISYLGFKHDRDAAKLGLERQKRLLERQSSVVEQYTLQCDASASEKSSADRRRAIDRAYRKYREADCAGLELDIEIGKVETTFHIEILESVRDLRANDVATRQDVIIAMRNLEMARKRMERATDRAAVCRREIEPATD